ncbi:C2H2 finger domain-containing protein [Apiospora saccharicola]
MNQDETAGAAQQPRKRGRPKGWKPGTPYNVQNGGGPSPANRPIRKAKSSSAGPNQEPKRRGRPPKPPDLTIREWFLQSDPKYMTFDCEWHEENLKGKLTQCPAELHNMDTLRKHVFYIHSNTEPLVCRWGPCGNKLAEMTGSQEDDTNEAEHRQQHPVEFEDEEAFRAHVEKEHLDRYVWQMGDGPQNKGIWTIKRDPNKLPRYLFGQDGDQITPSIKDQQFEDTQGMLIRKRRLREIQRQALENAPDESEFFLPPPDSET